MNLGTENERQEFKLGLGQLDKGLKSLAAMLNRHEEGTVFFGVDDNGEVRGIDVGKKTLLDIRNRIADLIEPKVICESRSVFPAASIFLKISFPICSSAETVRK